MGDALTPVFSHCDVVRTGADADTEQLGVSNKEGIILGISHTDNDGYYAVSFDGETVMLSGRSMTGTGRRVSRDEIYSGDSIVDPREGRARGEEFRAWAPAGGTCQGRRDVSRETVVSTQGDVYGTICRGR